MVTDLAEKKGTALARPLKVLVPLIKEELEAGDAAGVEHYRRAGEMLQEAKEQVGHGEWRDWLERNFSHLSVRTAQDYMMLAAKSKKRGSPRFSTIQEAVAPNRPPRYQAPWHEPVREIAAKVNVEALAKERQNREREERLMHTLAMQLIDIGYKVLASKLHPDKGGSAEAMARLNKVRQVLREAI